MSAVTARDSPAPGGPESAAPSCPGSPLSAGPAAPAFTGVRAFRSINQIAAAEWDSILPPDEIQLRHAFVRACEDADIEHAEYRHLLVFREGELAGIASLFRMTVRLELLCPGALRSLIEAARRVYPRFLRPTLLFCGLPVSAARPCIAFRSPADAPFVLAQVAGFMESVAGELGARLLCFKEFRPAEALLLDALREHGFFRAFSLSSFRMALPWQSYEAYLGAMRAGYRRQARVTLRRAAAAGISCRTVPGEQYDWARFFVLYEQVMDRARFQLERLNLDFFRNLSAYLPDCVRVIEVQRGDELLAAGVLLETSGLTTFFMTGIDYDLNGAALAYPALITEIVAHAIRSGTGGIELGQTSPALKGRVGGEAEPRYVYFRYRSKWAHALFELTAPLLFPEDRVPARRVMRS